MKKIVLGYDDSEASQRALERAAQLVKAFGSELVVTSVAPIMTSIGRSGGPTDPTDPPAKHAEELNLNLGDRRLRLTLELARQLMGTPRHPRAERAPALAWPERQRGGLAQGTLRRSGGALTGGQVAWTR